MSLEGLSPHETIQDYDEGDDVVSQGSGTIPEEDLESKLQLHFKALCKNDRLDRKSFLNFIRSHATWMGERDASKSFDDIDQNREGRINFSQFKTIFSRKATEARNEKNFIEKNFMNSEQIFDSERKNELAISLQHAQKLLKKLFHCSIPEDDIKELDEYMKGMHKKGIEKNEFKQLARALLSTPYAPKIIQVVYSTSKAASLDDYLFESLSPFALSLSNDPHEKDQKNLMEKMKTIISDNKVTKEYPHSKASGKIYNKEHFQKLLQEAEEEKEELMDEISSLRALLDALQMDAPQLIESENEHWQEMIKERESIIEDLRKERDSESEEKQEIMEHLKQKNQVFMEHANQMEQLKNQIDKMRSNQKRLHQLNHDRIQQMKHLRAIIHANEKLREEIDESSMEELEKRLDVIDVDVHRVDDPPAESAKIDPLLATMSKKHLLSGIREINKTTDSKENEEDENTGALVERLQAALEAQKNRVLEAEKARNKLAEEKQKIEEELKDLETKYNEWSDSASDRSRESASERQLDAALKALHVRKKRLRSLEQHAKINEQKLAQLQEAYRQEKSRKRSEGWMSENQMKQFQSKIAYASDSERKILELQEQLQDAVTKEDVTSKLLRQMREKEQMARAETEKAEERQMTLQQQLDGAYEMERKLLGKLQQAKTELETMKAKANASDEMKEKIEELQKQLSDQIDKRKAEVESQLKEPEATSTNQEFVPHAVQEENDKLKIQVKALEQSLQELKTKSTKTESITKKLKEDNDSLLEKLDTAEKRDINTAERLEHVWRKAQDILGEPKKTPDPSDSNSVNSGTDNSSSTKTEKSEQKSRSRRSSFEEEVVSASKRQQRSLSNQLQKVEQEFINLQNTLQQTKKNVKEARQRRRLASDALHDAEAKEEKVLQRLSSLGSNAATPVHGEDAYFASIEMENHVLAELQKIQEKKRVASITLEKAQVEVDRAKRREQRLLKKLKDQQETGEEALRQLDKARTEELVMTERQKKEEMKIELMTLQSTNRKQVVQIEELSERLKEAKEREDALLKIKTGMIDEAHQNTIKSAFDREKKSFDKLQETKSEFENVREKLRVTEIKSNKFEDDLARTLDALKKAQKRVDELREELSKASERNKRLKIRLHRVQKENEKGSHSVDAWNSDGKASKASIDNMSLELSVQEDHPEIDGIYRPVPGGGTTSNNERGLLTPSRKVSDVSASNSLVNSTVAGHSHSPIGW
eukprot:CAMPEP_0114510534 /NCGR_PEP_ID=MMETSP0109-20121206/13851_1 /TAXON_ID=29199 /ORGANISM="Chlorarachnion reptans, Strain CCCM449" /LENGTH=1225 /DNA_ID=CAMNT_0001689873 /DNA_START=30 /DNA_END=3704 /DNA_ORIENTATION=-